MIYQTYVHIIYTPVLITYNVQLLIGILEKTESLTFLFRFTRRLIDTLETTIARRNVDSAMQTANHNACSTGTWHRVCCHFTGHIAAAVEK